MRVMEALKRWGLDATGINPVTAQAIYLSNRQTLENLRMQQITTSVQLVEAIGGGREASQMPSTSKMMSRAP